MNTNITLRTTPTNYFIIFYESVNQMRIVSQNHSLYSQILIPY